MAAGKMEECMVFVFDYDGVLSVEGEPRRLGVRLLLEALDLDGRVYIVSGRPRYERDVIVRFLREQGVSPSRVRGIILRGRGSEEYHKLEAYRVVADREGCLGEIHDDNPEALWPARRIVARGLILHYDEYCEPLHGHSILPSCTGSERPRHGKAYGEF